MGDGVEQECLDRVVKATAVGWFAGPISSAILLAMLSGSANRTGLWIWFLLMNLSGLANFMTCRAYLRKRATVGVANWIPGQLTSALYGAVIGALNLLAFPASNHPEARALTVIFVCGAMATEIVEKAAKLSWFLSFNVPLACVSTIGLAIGWSTPLFGLMVAVFFAFCLYANRQAGATLRTAIETRTANGTLADALGEQVRSDSLTGLANRLGVIGAIDRSLASARSDGGTVALIFFDLDRFKSVNDTHGHGIGDALLRTVAERVRPLVRDADLVGRVGGDEFVIVLDRVDNPVAAMAAAERVRAALAGWTQVDGVSLTVTPSVGVATSLGPETTSDDLLRHADAALYRAKARGRNRVEYFDETLNLNLRRKRSFEAELREAIRTGSIMPWYQPTIDMETERIVGAEALARWIHPERGVLMAGEFIPLAEEVGLIDRIGDLMVLAAMSARADLAKLGVDDSFRLRFNVSPRQLARPDQFTRMKRLANREQCALHWLSAEITESAVLFDEQLAIEQLRGARELGLRIDIDDFGTGYSSLSLLRRLPIDGVKIDRSFVRDVATDPADAAIVAAVIDLTRRLGLSVVAEGVETSAQVTALRSLGCRVAQGFLWSPAVPIETFQQQVIADRPQQQAALTRPSVAVSL